MTTKKHKLLRLLTRTRSEIDSLAAEIKAEDGLQSQKNLTDKDLLDLKARARALEMRVSVIEGDA